MRLHAKHGGDRSSVAVGALRGSAGVGKGKGKGKGAGSGADDARDGMRAGEVPVVAEAFSIDKCLNLYLGILRWLAQPLQALKGGGQAAAGADAALAKAAASRQRPARPMK